jgi:hypothetical protein
VATSDARIEANRKNAQLSSGPKTPEGKAVCRQNALKHGLSGEGIVVPDEDREAISARFGRLEAELAPSTEMALILVQRIAMLSVRMERSARQEAAKLGEVMRRAASDFDDMRMATVEKLMDWIAAEPATNARRLRSTPEGVEKLIQAWLAIDADLAHFVISQWSWSQWQRIENLVGRRPQESPITREGALCKVLWGDCEFLEPGEVAGMDALDRRDYAIAQLRERVALRVAELRELAATFDMEALAKDRNEAATRALFDPSPQAVLARKYEAAAERGMYKALKELQAIEARGGAAPSADETPEPELGCAPLALNFPRTDADVGLVPPEESAKRLREVRRHRKGPGAKDRGRRTPV